MIKSNQNASFTIHASFNGSYICLPSIQFQWQQTCLPSTVSIQLHMLTYSIQFQWLRCTLTSYSFSWHLRRYSFHHAAHDQPLHLMEQTPAVVCTRNRLTFYGIDRLIYDIDRLMHWINTTRQEYRNKLLKN